MFQNAFIFKSFRIIVDFLTRQANKTLFPMTIVNTINHQTKSKLRVTLTYWATKMHLLTESITLLTSWRSATSWCVNFIIFAFPADPRVAALDPVKASENSAKRPSFNQSWQKLYFAFSRTPKEHRLIKSSENKHTSNKIRWSKSRSSSAAKLTKCGLSNYRRQRMHKKLMKTITDKRSIIIISDYWPFLDEAITFFPHLLSFMLNVLFTIRQYN